VTSAALALTSMPELQGKVARGEALVTFAEAVRDGIADVVPIGDIADVVLVRASRDPRLDPLSPAIDIHDKERVEEGGHAAVARVTGKEPLDATGWDSVGRVTFDGGSSVDVPWQWLYERACVLLCALHVGVVEHALRLTAEYTSAREQFGKPLGSFQAVQQRAADAYIDVEAMRWTMWQAAWRLEAGEPAAEAVEVAKIWSSEGGARVLAAAQHLHGGIGVDMDYPLHRYTFLSRRVQLAMGGTNEHVDRLGAML
jgi:hypothetical protein